MEIKNVTLINMIKALGEEVAAVKLQQKLDDDQARKDYHKKYNAKKNAILREVKQLHPELFKLNGR